jgi:hypothetical protein
MVFLRTKLFLVAALVAVLALAATSIGDKKEYAYIAPDADASRSPCPALNVLANHGYIHRDGKNISPLALALALHEAYNLDKTIAHFLAIGGYFLVHQEGWSSVPPPPPSLAAFKAHPREFLAAALAGANHVVSEHTLEAVAQDVRHWAANWVAHPTLDLHDIGIHNHIEHDASITHDDAPLATSAFAAWATNSSLFDAFMADAPGAHVDLDTLAAARVRRERESTAWSGRTLDWVHAKIARGEAALVIGIFGESAAPPPPGAAHDGAKWVWDGLGVRKDVMRAFWHDERLPVGWAPRRVTSLASTAAGNDRVGAQMDVLVARAANASAPALHGAQHVLAAQ